MEEYEREAVMKSKSIRRCLLAFLAGMLLLAPAARADMGPKPEVTIRVRNAPEGELYLDLLARGTPASEPYPNSEAGDYDPAIAEHLHSLEGDGWVLAYSTGVSGRAPVFGSVHPQAGLTWRFSYSGLPEAFRVAAATAESAQASETVYTRRYVDTIIYDCESNTVRPATPYPLYFTVQLLATLIPTLLLEGLVLWLFRFREKRTWLTFLAVNLVTQVGLHIFCGSVLAVSGDHPIYYVLTLLLPELVVWAAECAAFALLLREHSAFRRWSAALCANLVSFALGFFPLHLLAPVLQGL